MKTQRIISFLLLVLIIGFLSGCKSKNKLSKIEVNIDDTPSWVLNRPESKQYYIGIGVASIKDNHQNYADIAKQNALNDLASEIEVNIEANSLLYSMERNERFKQDYLSTTKTKSSLYLDQYERVDSYQNQEKFMVYYRLNKQTYRDAKLKRQNEAAEEAARFVSSARALVDKDVSLSLTNYLMAIKAVQDFLGDPLKISLNDENERFIGNLIYKEIEELLNNISLVYPNETLLYEVLDKQNEVGVFVNNDKSKVLSNIPFKIKVEGQLSGMIKTTSNNIGFIHLPLIDFKPSKLGGAFLFMLLVEDLIPESMQNDDLLKVYVSQFKKPEFKVGFNVLLPELFVISKELNLGARMNNEILKSSTKQAATTNGFVIASNQNNADVLVQIKSDTKEGSVQFDLFSVLLDAQVDFIEKKSKKIVYTYNLTGRKGVGLNYSVAGEKAYEKAGDKLKKELFKEFSGSLGY